MGFKVEEWVYPGTGAGSVTFLADDPAREVGAPAWPASQVRVLVIVSEDAPPAPIKASQGNEAVRQWREAGSPRLSDVECARA